LNTVTLEKLKIGAQQALSKHLADAQVNFDNNIIYEQLVMQVRGFIWSEQHQHIDIKYPFDWWQSFKERWFRGWMLQRWPVKYKTHSLDVKTLYPNYRPVVPDQEYRLRIFHQEGIDYGEYDDITPCQSR
jgi:hypothetical protein